MDLTTKTLLEAFNLLLENLGLQQNIWGYTVSLFLLTILLILKLFFLTCIAKYFQNCKKSNFELTDLDI